MVTAQKAYVMLGNENLWQAATECHRALAASGVPHSVCGGVAVCLHGYQRNTTDLNLIIRPEDSDKVRQSLEAAGLKWDEDRREFRSPQGIAIQFLLSGERAGNELEVKLPRDPGDPQILETIEGLPVLRLSRLIEIKLACGSGSLRRTHKDFADVVELIAIHQLDSSFARHLHKSLRKTFRELVGHARHDDADR